ncbi:hypothetical protein TNCV_4678721 [Trichonephila clavipes]|nr:hypothetical protein TNCV_4678721 [Trichonephila clavipes]
MELVIFNYGQVARTTPEMEPPSPNFPTTPTGGRLSLDKFDVHQPLLHVCCHRCTSFVKLIEPKFPFQEMIASYQQLRGVKALVEASPQVHRKS